MREKLNMSFWWQQLREEISPAQVIPKWGLRSPGTLLPMQPVRTLGKGMPELTAPHKSMPNLWSMGTLEDGLFPGMSWHPWGGPHLPNLESGMSTGMPRCPWQDPHISPEPQPNPTRVVSMMGPRFQHPCPCPRHELGTLGRWGSGRERDLLYSRHWSCFLALNFLLWPNSRLRTQNQEGLWSSLKAKSQLSITLSIWKIVPHNASVPDGTPRERFVIQIGGLYYHTPPRYSLYILHADGTWTIPIPHP